MKNASHLSTSNPSTSPTVLLRGGGGEVLPSPDYRCLPAQHANIRSGR